MWLGVCRPKLQKRMKIHKEVLYCGSCWTAIVKFKNIWDFQPICTEIIYNCCRLYHLSQQDMKSQQPYPCLELHKFCGCNVPHLSLPLCAWGGFRFIRFLGCTWRLWLAWTSASCRTHHIKWSNSRIYLQLSTQSLIAMWLLTQRHWWNYTEMCN